MLRRILPLLLLVMAAGCHDPLQDLLDKTRSGACFYVCASGHPDCFDALGLSESACDIKATTLCDDTPDRLTYLSDSDCQGSQPEWYRRWGADAFTAD